MSFMLPRDCGVRAGDAVDARPASSLSELGFQPVKLRGVAFPPVLRVDHQRLVGLGARQASRQDWWLVLGIPDAASG
jgi:hypothetical protein